MESDGIMKFCHDDYVETWKAIEKVDKSVKIVNFNKNQIERILKRTTEVVPEMDQIKSHPYLNQKKLIEFCKSDGAKITGYSPLGSSSDRCWEESDEDPKVMDVVEKYKKTPAPIVVYHQIGREIAFQKLVTKSEIEENFNVFDFNLSSENIKRVKILESIDKICPNDEEALTFNKSE